MTDPTSSRACLGALAIALPFLGACVHSSGGGSHHLSESEPNDDACCADYFGFLSPGEYLSIKGFISDDGFDPYDGFAFTAFEPISVDFRLYTDGPFADLDVCIYDPQLGITVDCYESPFNPETGTAHILLGGTDFHLVVNSFSGDASYTMEVEAYPLYLGKLPGGDDNGAVLGGAHSADEKPDRAADFAAYSGRDIAAAQDLSSREVSLIGLGELYILDESTGDMSTAFLGATSEGTLVWMGNPDEVMTSEGR